MTVIGKSRKYFRSLIEFLDCAPEKEPVLFSVGNRGNAPLAKNLARSCRKNSVELAFFGTDRRTARIISRESLSVDFSGLDGAFEISSKLSKGMTRIGSSGFPSLAWLRYPLIGAILRSGRIAIYLDTDVVVRRNFLPEILVRFEQNQLLDGLVQMNDKGQACTGVLAFHPRSLAKFDSIFNENYLKSKEYESMGALADQEFFNLYVMPQPKNDSKLAIEYLSREEFPTGKWWYANSNSLKSSVRLVHYNGVTGAEEKIALMKSYGDWSST